MKKKSGGVLSILLAFIMTFAMVVPVSLESVYAAGIEVEYTSSSPNNQKVKEGSEEYQVYCIAQGRPYARPDEYGGKPLSGKRFKYAWNETATEYNAIAANTENSLFPGANFTYALSWAILGGMYTSDGNPRTDLDYAFRPNSSISELDRLAQILKNIFYYAELDGHSSNDVQLAIYQAITNGNTDTAPRGWTEGSLIKKAWAGQDNGNTELWVYLPDPNEIKIDNPYGYQVQALDQALVRGVPHIGPEVTVWLQGHKVIEGEGAPALQDEMFSFTISGPGIEDTTKVNYGNDIWFPELTFDKAGTYTYTIKENATNVEGITIDDPKTLVLVVEEKEENDEKYLILKYNGEQIASSKDAESTRIDGNVDGLKFVNTYSPGGDEPTPDPTKPTVATQASSNNIKAEANQSITDTITLTNLKKDVEYTITGKLMVKGDNKEVETYTSEPVKFTAEADGDATQTMVFTGIDCSDLGGKSIVVFETLSWEGDAHGDTNEVKHEDLNDSKQTVSVPANDEPSSDPTKPTVATQASSNDIKAEANQSITDTITLTNLKKDVEYTITGKLMVMEDNEEVETYTSEPVKFTAEADGNSTQTMVFTGIDCSDLGGKSIVVFETLSWEGDAHGDTNEVKHEDLNDSKQTVSVPTNDKPTPDPTPTEGKLKTTVSCDGVSGSPSAAAEVVIETELLETDVTDKIDYEGLNAGSTYKVSGQLIEVETDKVVKTVTDELVAEAASGTWEVTFKKVELKAGKTYVVYESATEIKDKDDNKVTDGQTVEHKDKNDKAQTLVVTKSEEQNDNSTPGTLKTTVSAKGHEASASAPAEIKTVKDTVTTNVIDTIDYSGLIKDATYKVSGTLNEIDGEKVKAVKTVTENKKAEGTDGSWEVIFEDVELKAGKKYVVFENATPVKDADGSTIQDGETIKHEDVNDKAQTIVIKAQPAPGVIKKVEGLDTFKVNDIDSTIKFTLTSDIPEDVSNWELIDNLPEPLVYVDGTLSVSVDGEVDDDLTKLADTSDTSIKLIVNDETNPAIHYYYGKKIVVSFEVALDENVDLLQAKFVDPVVNVATVTSDGVMGEYSPGTDENAAEVLGIYDAADKAYRTADNGNNNNTVNSRTRGVKTGDTNTMPLFIAMLLVAAAAVTTIIIRRKKTNK